MKHNFCELWGIYIFLSQGILLSKFLVWIIPWALQEFVATSLLNFNNIIKPCQGRGSLAEYITTGCLDYVWGLNTQSICSSSLTIVLSYKEICIIFV